MKKSVLAYVALVLFLVLGARAASAQASLVLDPQRATIPLWPHVRLLLETDKVLSLSEVLNLSSAFQRPIGNAAVLGVKTAGTWLDITVTSAAPESSTWVLEFEYAPLQKIDIYVFEESTLLQEAAQGALRAFAARPLQSRTSALPLTIKPNTAYRILARVETRGSQVLPIALKQPPAFHTDQVVEHLLQGLVIGIALCLLGYSLFYGIVNRDTFFLKYATLVAGAIGTGLLQTGLGAQYLWTGWPWIETHIAGLATLTALLGTYLFLEEALREPAAGKPPLLNYSFLMHASAVLVVLLMAAFALDIIGLPVLAPFMMILGPMPTLLSLPRMFRRVAKRDAVGVYLLLAFTVYAIGATVTTLLVRGSVPANFWTMHAFQFAGTIDILAFLYVLTASTRATQFEAYRARCERDQMASLAHTDALTGVLNRRGFNEALAAAVPRATATYMAAVYVIDVDGFKPVNDQYGHDVGDKLLIAIADRLSHHARTNDVVARVGGDEFIVLAANFTAAQQAAAFGAALLAAFAEPISLAKHRIPLGITVGYAILPLDAIDAESALKLADTAMYAGKQAGKNFLRRAISVRATASQTVQTEAVKNYA